MEIVENRLVKIFKNEYEGKAYYKMGISKKDQNGNYINGYLDVRFRKDITLDNGINIYIKKGWIDFYLKDKKTIPYIFINEFETVAETVEKAKEEVKQDDVFEEFGKQIEIDDNELPFE